MAIIQLISGPRNISTALMYAFGNRADCNIIDEPYYAHYLARTGLDHPGRDEVLASLPTASAEVLDLIHRHDRDDGYLFVKNMAHHIDGYDYSYSTSIRNVFLIRDPRRLIASFAKVMPDMTAKDTGLAREAALHRELYEASTRSPIVIDSGRLLTDPEAYLRALCDALDIPWNDDMLAWEAGPREEDGVWAKYWYASAHQSTGFSKPPSHEVMLPDRLQDLYEEVAPYYDYLLSHALKI